MSKSVAFAAFLLLIDAVATVGIAAEIRNSTMTCNDGTEVYLESACAHRGGLKKVASAAPPVKVSKGFTSSTTTSTKKTKAAATSKNRKKTASRSTRDPTAKCLDGALYYSTKRQGACAAHGGVDKWYGW